MSATEGADATTEELAAEVELLTEENDRLRTEYARAQRTRYRRTAVALAIVGLAAVGGGALFPGSRNVLFALGATGVFGGLLTFYLTPGQFLPASIGERVYDASARNGDAIASELGLADIRLYVPIEEPDQPARLYIPQHEEFTLPDDLTETFVAADDEPSRGISLQPTGAGLFGEFQQGLAGELATTPDTLAQQLADAIVEQFELASTASTDADENQLVVGISDSAYGSVDRFDHPIASFVAVGTAVAVDAPVSLEVTGGDDRSDYLITCSWDTPSD